MLNLSKNSSKGTISFDDLLKDVKWEDNWAGEDSSDWSDQDWSDITLKPFIICDIVKQH